MSLYLVGMKPDGCFIIVVTIYTNPFSDLIYLFLLLLVLVLLIHDILFLFLLWEGGELLYFRPIATLLCIGVHEVEYKIFPGPISNQPHSKLHSTNQS